MQKATKLAQASITVVLTGSVSHKIEISAIRIHFLTMMAINGWIGSDNKMHQEVAAATVAATVAVAASVVAAMATAPVTTEIVLVAATKVVAMATVATVATEATVEAILTTLLTRE